MSTPCIDPHLVIAPSPAALALLQETFPEAPRRLHPGRRVRELAGFLGHGDRMVIDFEMPADDAVGRIHLPAAFFRCDDMPRRLVAACRGFLGAEDGIDPDGFAVVQAFAAWCRDEPARYRVLREAAAKRATIHERECFEANPLALPADPAAARAAVVRSLAAMLRATEARREEIARAHRLRRRYEAAAFVAVPTAAEIAAWNADPDPMGLDATGVADIVWDCVLGRFLALVAIAPGRDEAEAWLAWARARFGARAHVAFGAVEAR